MSYLNSILASIGDEQSSPASASAKPPVTSRAAVPVRPNPTAIDGGTQNPQAVKRKAEEELSNAPAKIARPLTPGQNGTAPRPIAAASSSGIAGYRGTARPEVGKSGPKVVQKPQTASNDVASTIKAEPKPSALVRSTTAIAVAPAPAPAAAPKKGSFKEILARANKLQQTTAPIGIIKHKQTEKLSKKELDRVSQEQAAKGKSVPIRDKKLGNRSRTGSSEPAPRKAGEQPKEKRKPMDLGYSGTARPKSKSAEPQYKGTMSLARPGQNRKAPVDKASRYTRYADSEEDLKDEEEEDYESDLSDMEAGLFDVDDEEELALREAKKEDERERALENELKRKKAERKNKLAEMAAAARKKKPIY